MNEWVIFLVAALATAKGDLYHRQYPPGYFSFQGLQTTPQYSFGINKPFSAAEVPPNSYAQGSFNLLPYSAGASGSHMLAGLRSSSNGVLTPPVFSPGIHGPYPPTPLPPRPPYPTYPPGIHGPYPPGTFYPYVPQGFHSPQIYSSGVNVSYTSPSLNSHNQSSYSFPSNFGLGYNIPSFRLGSSPVHASYSVTELPAFPSHQAPLINPNLNHPCSFNHQIKPSGNGNLASYQTQSTYPYPDIHLKAATKAPASSQNYYSTFNSPLIPSFKFGFTT